MSKSLSSTVYFDNAATTAPLPSVVDRLTELMTTVMGNSSSAHKKGRQAQEVLDHCHETLGRYFDLPPSHVVFTSGGTESNNLAIWGSLGGMVQAFQWLKIAGDQKGKLLTTTVEHAASSRVFEVMECMGAPVGWLNVDQEGLLDLNELESELNSSRMKILSLHHAQNEIGVVQDIKRISALVRSKQPDAIIHIDAVQSFMKIPVSLHELGVDLVSISAHKFGGPKGVGALILGPRFENRSPKIGTLINGSPQQFGIRPGTVPVPNIGAMITAVEWGAKNLENNRQHLLSLRTRLVDQLPEKALINGPREIAASNPRRAPQTLNFSIPGLPSPVAVEALSARGFCVSSGAACNSTNPKPNETILAMGHGRDRALSALRVSLGPQNTAEEVDAFIPALKEVIEQYS